MTLALVLFAKLGMIISLSAQAAAFIVMRWSGHFVPTVTSSVTPVILPARSEATETNRIAV